VIKDVPYDKLADPSEPMILWPLCEPWRPDLVVQVRAAGDAGGIPAAIRSDLRALAPTLPLRAVRALAQIREAALHPTRWAAGGLGLLGGIGLGLAAVGTFGVRAFRVIRCTREIGIQMALDARSNEVLGLFPAQALRLGGRGSSPTPPGPPA
jgi:hypothetical protein